MHKRCLLLSGGMDSTALAYWLRPEYAFTLNYGQKSALAEIIASKKIASLLNIKHHVLTVDCSSLGTGDLSGKEPVSIAPKSDWWPYRNQMLVTLCSMMAVQIGISELIIGTVRNDGYHKDGSKDFYELLNQLMSFQEGGLIISTPAIDLTTLQLINKSKIPLEILMWSHSCHKSEIPCRNCRGCNKYFSTLNKLSQSND